MAVHYFIVTCNPVDAWQSMCEFCLMYESGKLLDATLSLSAFLFFLFYCMWAFEWVKIYVPCCAKTITHMSVVRPHDLIVLTAVLNNSQWFSLQPPATSNRDGVGGIHCKLDVPESVCMRVYKWRSTLKGDTIQWESTAKCLSKQWASSLCVRACVRVCVRTCVWMCVSVLNMCVKHSVSVIHHVCINAVVMKRLCNVHATLVQVLEHQPLTCKELPSSGYVGWTDIQLSVNDEVVTSPEWVAKLEGPKCMWVCMGKLCGWWFYGLFCMFVFVSDVVFLSLIVSAVVLAVMFVAYVCCICFCVVFCDVFFKRRLIRACTGDSKAVVLSPSAVNITWTP